MTYTCICIEGGLLSPDILERIHELRGQKPRDFGLAAQRALVDEIASVWGDTRIYWAGLQRRVERAQQAGSGESITTITREQWIIPLLEALGYQLKYQRRAAEVDGRAYVISHRAGDDESAPPIHIVGWEQELGSRPPSGRGRLSPHALIQDYLNRTEHLWGVVTNGHVLRLLRDSSYFTRPAYIEFDLKQMLEGERLDEFILFYRLVHRSRLPRGMEDAPECLLEQYHQDAIEQGGRIRDGLRDAVVKAILMLGNGFLHHPKNETLRENVRNGRLQVRAFYKHVLYLIYRLLFLMVAEERNLLASGNGKGVSGNGAAADYFGAYLRLGRLRALADEPLSAPERFDDLYLGLQTLFYLLRDEGLAGRIGLAPLNGQLFDPLGTIDGTRLNNRDLLTAVRSLSYFTPPEEKVRRRVNYAALDVEELGSVYESLLEFQPQIVEVNGRLNFYFVAGTERKSTGSYYTRPELVNELVESALVPVIEDRLAKARRMANGEWSTEEEKRYAYSVVSRTRRMATGNEPGKTSLPTDSALPARGTLRDDVADPSGGGVHSGEHRGRLGSPLSSRVRPIPPQGEREPHGTGNASAPVPGGATVHGETGQATPPGSGDSRQATGQTGAKSSTREEELAAIWRLTPLATRRSLLAEHALLSIKVCDPACGSGHFLLAAARRIGRELARVRTGEDEPSPDAVRGAVRDVITHCIYGVDKNPLAVDLCKVALWIEGHSQGKPLTFLDHRIRCGDSLVGVLDLSVLRDGIPDDAFKPVTGDEKSIARALKQQNRKERKGEPFLPFSAREELTKLAGNWETFETLPDDTPEQVRQKREAFERLQQQGSKWWHDQTASHLWTAAFFAKLTETSYDNQRVPTTEDLWSYMERPNALDARLTGAAWALAATHRFFHWPLEFPEVFAQGGFDVVLCNPPWERIKLQEQEFFATRDPEIARAPNKAARERLIRQLPERNPELWREYRQALHTADALSKFLRHSTRCPLTAHGDINTYAVFAELARQLLNPNGHAGIIVPTGIATDDTCKQFFADLNEKRALASLFDFENREVLFPGVHRNYKFCLLTMSGRAADRSDFAFFLLRTEQLHDEQRRFTLAPDDLALLNPNTRTCPIFRTQADAELTRKIYRRVPVLVDEQAEENPWGVRFMTMFHMANDSGLFETTAGDGLLPLYEAKFINQFNHRHGTCLTPESIRGNQADLVTEEQHADPELLVRPRYWVPQAEVEARLARWPHGWLIGFRDVTRAVDLRTCWFSLLPRVAVGHKIPLVFLETTPDTLHVACFLANINSFVLDFVARQKIGGISMSYFILKQLPVLPPAAYTTADIEFTAPRVLELVYTAWDIKPFADDVWKDAANSEQRMANGDRSPLTTRHSPLQQVIRTQWEENRRETGGHEWNPPEWAEIAEDGIPLPPFKWDEARRAQLRAELDANYARLYGLTRDELRYILDPADVYGEDFPGETFRVLKEKEIRQFGEYRTRRLVLEAWNRLF